MNIKMKIDNSFKKIGNGIDNKAKKKKKEI